MPFFFFFFVNNNFLQLPKKRTTTPFLLFGTELLLDLGEGGRVEISFTARLNPCMSNLAWSKFSQLNYKPCKQEFMMEMLTQP